MKSSMLCLLTLLLLSSNVQAKVQEDRYDLVCRGPLGEYHKFKNVPYNWKDYMQPSGYIQAPSGRRTYFIKEDYTCILMKRPYFEN